MVEPMTMGVLIGGNLLGQGLNFFESGKQAAIAQAANDLRVQALQNQIIDARIKAARKSATVRGSGVVAAGAQGVQFTGSITEATRSAAQQVEYDKLLKISELKVQQMLTRLSNQSTQVSAASQQLGAIVSGATTIGTKGQNLIQSTKTNEELG